MISGFLEVSTTPKTNYLYLWRHQDTFNNPRKNASHVLVILFRIRIKQLQINNFENVGTDACRTKKNMNIRLKLSWESWTQDQHLPENTKCIFVNMHHWNFKTLRIDTKKPRTQDTEQLRNQETRKPRHHQTKKLWNQETETQRYQETKKPRKH